MGIAAKVTSGEIRTSDQLLDALAKTAKTAGSEAQFTADIYQIFGRRVGVELAAALKDGGDALAVLEAQMRSSGTVISEQLIRKLADANEAIDAFKERMQRQMVIAAGHVIEFGETAFHTFDNLTGVLQPVVEDWMSSLDWFFDNADTGFDDFHKLIRNTLQDIDNLRNINRTAAQTAGNAVDFLTGGLIPAGSAGPRSDLAGEFDRRQQARMIERAGRIYRHGRTGGGDRDPVTRPPPTRTPRARAARQPRAGRPEKTNEELWWDFNKSALGDTPSLTVGSISDIQHGIRGVSETLAGMPADGLARILSPEEDRRLQEWSASFRADMEELDAHMGDLPNIADLLPVEDQQRLEEFVQGLNRSLADGLAAAIAYGENLGDVLVNTFKRAGFELLSSGILNLLSGGKEGTSFATFFQNIGTAFGAKKLPGRAYGGPVYPGQEYLVGENGPEIIRPRVPGVVIPNHAARSGGGGVTIHQTVNAPGASAETVTMIRRELAAAAPMIVQAAKGETIRHLSRPRL